VECGHFTCNRTVDKDNVALIMFISPPLPILTLFTTSHVSCLDDVHDKVGSESDSQRGYSDKLEQLRSSDASNRRIIGQLNSQVRGREDK
jgi:hypothetical protein